MADMYDQIISAVIYIRLMCQHLYVLQTDLMLRDLVRKYAPKGGEVVGLGCGPGRMERVFTNEDFNLTCVDVAGQFLEYARKALGWIRFVLADAATYSHGRLVDVFYSQGFNHHDLFGKYLRNIFRQLRPGGVYILCDECLAPYRNERERRVKSVLWHAHIIADALARGHRQLAIEEAKTLIDDLSWDRPWHKTKAQIKLVLKSVAEIEYHSARGNVRNAHRLAKKFLARLESRRGNTLTGDPKLDLSRGDHKVSEAVLRARVTRAGFVVESVLHVGPAGVSGSFIVMVLRRPQ